MKLFPALLLLLICTHAFCQKNDSKNYGTVSLPKDDSIFLALKDTAQAHLHTFVDSLNIHGSDTAHYRFGVKSDFVQGDDHEHMWSLILSYDNGNFKGVFIDSAYVIKNIKTGDRVTIKLTEIEDWSINNRRTGKTIGYFSEMYLNSKEK